MSHYKLIISGEILLVNVNTKYSMFWAAVWMKELHYCNSMKELKEKDLKKTVHLIELWVKFVTVFGISPDCLVLLCM